MPSQRNLARNRPASIIPHPPSHRFRVRHYPPRHGSGRQSLFLVRRMTRIIPGTTHLPYSIQHNPLIPRRVLSPLPHLEIAFHKLAGFFAYQLNQFRIIM
jgi:hypothetical protein